MRRIIKGGIDIQALIAKPVLILSIFVSLMFFSLSVIILPYPALASHNMDLEKDLQKSLEEDRAVARKGKDKSRKGESPASEMNQLKTGTKGKKASHLLLLEKFGSMEEEMKSLGPRALERHQAMSDNYEKAMDEYLSLIDNLPPSEKVSEADIDEVETYLDKILHKRKIPILGSLPYRNLNYPSKEPGIDPSIKPAYKGGNKVVNPEDTKGTDEAPISEEIATLAQSLNWNPVSIYEYVKNDIETEWYWGCMKGAEETLRQKSGNDCDQATLLTALLRSSGFPSRYVRGVIEFPSLGQVQNLTGIDDPAKIADFFQKAGIPHKSIISAGTIANFQIEHVWVESLIPYSNYRGAVIDNYGKTWLGLDTSIKVSGYTYNNAIDLFQQPAISDQLSALRDEYLSIIQTLTPIEYLEAKLTADGYQLSDLMRTKTLIPEIMDILPASMQYDQIAVTHEYTEIPDELKHMIKFTTSDANNSELFSISLNSLRLSNRKITLSYEPETVEDQQIIDFYGGLDNTPAYLVRLRPVLKVDGEMVVAGKDGLPMGSDYELTIELISPNGTEKTTSTHIAGNLVAVGITAGRVTPSGSPLTQGGDSSAPSPLGGEGGGEGDKDAEQLLYEEANSYINGWNEAEDELTSLLHLAFSRPVPTVVTVGGVIEVTYLLDVPHGIEWKGVFIDASFRSASPVPSHESQVTSDRQKTFMQLSALEGSILENRLFEDAFQGDSISTAKLFQLVSDQQSALSGQLFETNKSNIDTILPYLTLDDNIKEDITNAVNQGLVIRMPQLPVPSPQSLITYKDWTGIGYIKEDPQTGEAGYMLSGMIAGGMTAIKKQNWINQDLANALSLPYSQKVNKNPNSVVYIARLNRKADYQSGIVGTNMKTAYQVIALDSDNRPVEGVNITFKVISGGGQVQGEDKGGNVIAPAAEQVSVTTGSDGIARARLTLGRYTSASPYLLQDTDAAGNSYWEQTGLNLVAISAQAKKGTISSDKPFEAYGRPAEAKEMIKLYPTIDLYGPPSIFASTLWVKVVDAYGNPISDKKVQYKVTREFLGTPPVSGAISAKLFGSISDCPGIATIDCPNSKVADVDPFVKRTEYFGSQPYLILGNTENTKFTITATANKDYFDSKGKRIDNSTALNNIDFKFYTKAVENGYISVYSAYAIDEQGNKIDVWHAGEISPQPLTVAMYYTEKTANGTFNIMPVVKDPPVGSPLKNDARIEFQISAGGGSVNPVIQTQDTNGSYSTTLKLGDTPGMNRINAIGTVTASVPSYDASGNITRTDKSLNAYFPIEIWGVKIMVPSYQMIMVGSEGYLKADVPFKYEILPSTYQYLPSQVNLLIYELGQSGNEAPMGLVQADSNGKLILTMGTAIFDNQKSYYAQVVINKGTKAELKSDKIVLGRSGLIPDYNRDGIINDLDRKRAVSGDTFYFWVNDDDDEGETGGTDVPGEIHFSDGLLNYENKRVDGVRDLIDFFPVYLDIKSLISLYSPNEYSYRLVSEDESLNFAYTYLKAASSGEYLTGGTDSLEPALTLGNTVTYKIVPNGTLLDTAFLQYISDAETGQGLGVILLEGRKASKKPLALQIYDSDNKLVYGAQLNLSLSGVEEMFRHKNLSPAANTELVPDHGSNAGEVDRLDVTNCPDVECLETDSQNVKNFVFLHGYNVNGQEARGWHSETFKRMFWSGSKARFWGVTWYGWDSQTAGATPNYHINVQHAFDTAPVLRNFIRVDVPGEVTIAAHSLGNMVVSSMLTDYASGWASSTQIKNYFMIDAAVASEAYGSRDDNNYTEMNKESITNSNMTHPDWNAYENRLWASEWHLLFKGQTPSDNREKLTWRNIFAVRPSAVKYYNFYSSGEEVLGEHIGDLNINDLIEQFKQTGIYTWALQEKFKGITPTNGILGSNYGGWGFNGEWDVFDLNIMEFRRMTPTEASNIENEQIPIHPFYLEGNETTLFEETGSKYALENKIRLLADAFPARTLAAGKNQVASLLKDEATEEVNFDMQEKFKTRKLSGIYWPADRNPKNWRHNDIKKVAYLYLYQLYDKFVGNGGLK